MVVGSLPPPFILLLVAILFQRFLVLDTASAPPLSFTVAAMLPQTEFSDWSTAFHSGLVSASAAASRDPPQNDSASTTAETAATSTAVNVTGISLTSVGGVRPVLVYVCDAVQHRNISAFIVVGHQRLINTVLTATRFLNVPLLAYNVDRSAVNIRVSTFLLFCILSLVDIDCFVKTTIQISCIS